MYIHICLCLEEKLCILEHAENTLLNKSELIYKCRHINIFPMC